VNQRWQQNRVDDENILLLFDEPQDTHPVFIARKSKQNWLCARVLQIFVSMFRHTTYHFNIRFGRWQPMAAEGGGYASLQLLDLQGLVGFVAKRHETS
jgi:hypothetical protein